MYWTVISDTDDVSPPDVYTNFQIPIEMLKQR
jgi:hypothetical protein